MAASRSLYLLLFVALFALTGCEAAVDMTPDAAPDPACGDGKRDEGEECDDGNLIDGDGCSSECAIEYRIPECQGAEDGSPCYQGERICRGGVCVIADCAEASDCAERACIGAAACELGECVYGAPLENGTECGEGRVCQEAACVSTACTSDTDCPAKSSCHAASSCDFENLECVYGAALADGTLCDGGGRCLAGECVNAECTADAECAHSDPCAEAGSCDLTTFRCAERVSRADRTECTTLGGTAGYCFLGECTGRCLGDADCDNGEECDGVERCSPSLRCESDAATRPDVGAPCEIDGGGAGICTLAGICLPGACTSDSECQPSDACRGNGACVDNACEEPDQPLPDGTPCGAGGMGVCLGGACDESAECQSAGDCAPANSCAIMECSSQYACVLADDQSASDGAPCEVGGEPGSCLSGECELPSCGNGILEAGEQCDDENNVAGDGCSPRCRLELSVSLGSFELIDPHVFLADSLDASMATDCQDFTDSAITVDGVTIPAFNSQLGVLGTLTLIVESVNDEDDDEDDAALLISGGGLPAALSGTYDAVCIDPPDDGVLTPSWGGVSGAINQPADDCITARFGSAPPIARLNLAGASVDLRQLALGAEWHFDTDTNNDVVLLGFKTGTLRAFLRADDADDAELEVAGETIPLSAIFSGGAASCRPANSGSPEFERDTHGGFPGWWLFFNFDGSLDGGDLGD